MTHFVANYFHTIVGYQKPCQSNPINNVLEGIKKITGYMSKGKAPNTVKQFYSPFSNFGGKRTWNFHI